jgi:altronate dehydratase large subunit
MINAYLRQDGRKGIRNYILVTYLVECAHHVAREIAYPTRTRGTQLIGFSGCFPNGHSHKMMERLCTHPNVGGVLLVSLGCEGFNKGGLLETVRASGRPAKLVVIQDAGGTRKTIAEGQAWVEQTLKQLEHTPRASMNIDELVVGTKCGGSDATSGLTANPAMGRAFDFLVEQGAACIFEETGELIGMERWMAERAATPELGQEIINTVAKAARYYAAMGHASFAPGNADGGLTTIEEKSLGAYAKSGQSSICGILKPGDHPIRGGLYLMDMIPDGDVRWGFPNINDNTEVAELIACGSHVVLFSTGRGSVVGSAVSPVIKVCANPKTYKRMSDDMDVDAGRILEGRASLDEVGREVYERILAVANGEPTKSEGLGHQEFQILYKSFEPLGPACFPSAA